MVDSQLRARLGSLGHGEVLGDRVFETLSDAIVEGRLAPGEHVSDKKVAEALDISRTPVREALRHLSWLGLVEVLPNRFTRVTEVSAETIGHTLEYTGMQAGVAIQLAMRRMDAAALSEAVHLLDNLIAASDASDADDLMLAGRMFVGFLTQQSGNPIFAERMYAADLLVQRNLRRTAVILGTAESRGRSFRAMRAAMLVGDGDAAELWFRREHRSMMDQLPQWKAVHLTEAVR